MIMIQVLNLVLVGYLYGIIHYGATRDINPNMYSKHPLRQDKTQSQQFPL